MGLLVSIAFGIFQHGNIRLGILMQLVHLGRGALNLVLPLISICATTTPDRIVTIFIQ